MLEDAREVLNQSRKQSAGHAQMYGLNGPEDMGHLILGDSITNVTQQSKSGIGKWLALAGLVTTGIGLWQAPAIIEAFKDDPSPVVQPDFTDTDTDTQFELSLGKPE